MPRTKVLKKPHAVADLEARIVQQIHAAGGLSRVDLSRSLGVVASTSGIYVDRLVAEGILLESETVQRGLGRPPCLLQLNPTAGRFVGIDFDARNLQVVVLDFAQNLLSQTQHAIPTDGDATLVLKWIAEIAREAMGAKSDDVLGVGLAVPGPVDADRGVSLHYAHLRKWENVPIGPYLAGELNVVTSVENNLRSMALAEWHAPAGRGLRSLVCLGVRSGIGSGIIVDGRLLTGSQNQAGEIRRWRLPIGECDGRQYAKTVEDVASISALLQRSGIPNLAEFFTHLQREDAGVMKLVAEAAGVHGWILHQLDAVFDPERLILAGPLLEASLYTQAVSQAVAELGGERLVDRLHFSNLGKFAGARGAAALAFQRWKPQR